LKGPSVCWAGVLACGLAGAAQATDLAPGATYTEYWVAVPGGNTHVYVVAADFRSHPEYKLELGWAQHKRKYTSRERTSTIFGRYNNPPSHEVLAGVNAEFFDTVNLPRVVGIGQSDGQMLDTPALNAAYLYQTMMIGPARLPVMVNNFSSALGTLTFPDGFSMILHQFNFNMSGPLTPINNQTFAFTPGFDSVTPVDFSASPSFAVEVQLSEVSFPMRSDKEVSGMVTAVLTPTSGHTPIPAGGMVLSTWGTNTTPNMLAHAHVGDRLRMRFRTGSQEYNNSDNSVTGIGWLVHNGAANTANWASLDPGAAVSTRNPRTALAWNNDFWFLVVCDGRNAGGSAGFDFSEMAEFLIGTLGALEAVNMDSGGSATLVTGGQVKNQPSDGSERAVANAMLLVKQDTSTQFPFSDPFAGTGRLSGWDDKFAYNAVVPFAPTSPSGDGYVLVVMEPGGGVNTVRRGDFGDADYSVEADVYCEYRPQDAADGFERGGLLARDSGTGAMGLSTYGGGNCYALVYDSDTGAVRGGKYVNGTFTDLLTPGLVTVTSSGWHRFRLDGYGPAIRYWLDGARLGRVTDQAFVRGYFGLGYHEFFAANANAHGTRADNFRAFVDPASWSIRGDFDDDHDVDLEDFGVFQACFSGDGHAQTKTACAGARLDNDNDVDAADLDLFQECFSGPGIPPPATCEIR
jgi:hypothetical protein